MIEKIAVFCHCTYKSLTEMCLDNGFNLILELVGVYIAVPG